LIIFKLLKLAGAGLTPWNGLSQQFSSVFGLFSNLSTDCGISEASLSKRVPIFLRDVRGGKQTSSYFGQELRQTQGVIKVQS